MGCASSTAVEAREARHEARMHDMIGNMMQQAQQMQQESIARQQQMARDDPECQVILDKHLELQKRGLVAVESGDQAEINKVQLEIVELTRHPKYLKMMMPVTMPNTQAFSSKSGSRGKTTYNTTTFASTNIGGGNTYPDMNCMNNNMFQQMNQNPAGNMETFHTTTNNPTSHNFGTPSVTPGGGGGFDFGSSGGGNDFGSSGGNNFGCGGNDFGSSGGNNFGSSGCNDF